MPIYLIRHGESTANKEKAFQGWNDVHLSAKGIIQAKKLSAYFSREKIRFTKIFASPLARARETAEPLIMCSDNPDIIIIDGFKSINVGDWGGWVISTVEKEFADEYHIWRTTPELFRFPNGESLIDIQNRSLTSLHQILDKIEDSTSNIAMVSHMMTIKVLALSMLDKNLANVWEKEYTVPNTGMMIFDYKKDALHEKIWFQRRMLRDPTPHL